VIQRGGDDGRVGAVLALAVGSVTVLVAVAAWVLARHQWPTMFGSGTPAITYGISLVPDETGTLVEIIGETSGDLPLHVDVDLRTVDDVPLAKGGPATGDQLHYSDVTDGLGNIMPAEQVRSGRLRGVGTDGRRLQLSFHVASVGNQRRIVYPIPQSPDLTWVLARLYPQDADVSCWADSSSGGGSAFTTCENPKGDEIDGSKHTTVRLVVQPSKGNGAVQG
jgi:hypothetical protein